MCIRDRISQYTCSNYTKVPCGTLCLTQHRINESAVLTLVSDTLRAIAEYSVSYTHLLFLNDSVPEEHKAGIDMRRDMLRRSHTLIVCGSAVDEDVKNDIAVAGRLGIAATTLEGVLAVKGHEMCIRDSHTVIYFG